MASDQLNPFLLAANVPEPDPRLIPLLQSQPGLASKQDSHGYSLLHAAASYNHLALLRSLVQDFNVNVNLKDEDGETCLFVAETIEIAKCLIEELGADMTVQNDEGMTAGEKIESEGDFPEVAAYIRQKAAGTSGESESTPSTNGSSHPPPLPPNMQMNFSTITEADDSTASQEPDPEFRRRIEELAAKENFNTEEGQRELRDLITDAVRGVNTDEREAQRRKVE